jgi:DNA polymerase I-like protein with 3'-5' exonuclease and polymerase domains
MVASYMLNPDEQHNLDALSQKWLNYSQSYKFTNWRKEDTQISMKDVKPELIVDYAAKMQTLH